MAGLPSIGIIVGIAGGGTVVIFGISVLLIRLHLRRKHRRRMTQINLDGEGGLSRRPSSHMHITDEDVARMPGTNAAAQRSLQGRYNPSPNMPMSSLGMRESRPVMRDIERVKHSSRADCDEIVYLQPWPLPRRSLRSDGIPLSNSQAIATSPIDARGSRKPSPTKGIQEQPRISHGNVSQSVDLRTIQDRVQNNISPSAVLRPKPLFHGQQRSVSHSIISDLGHGKTETAGLYVVETKESSTRSEPRSRHPRSASLCSQEPGIAPTLVLPPLPFETAQRRQGVKSPTDFSTCGSLFSEDTSILDDDEARRVFPDAGIKFISHREQAHSLSSPVSEPPKKRLGIWDSAELQERASPLSAAKALKFRPQISSQKSCRVSIQDSLPESTSTGLSMSLLDHASQNASATDLVREEAQAFPKPRPKIQSPKKIARNKSKPDGPISSSPLKNGTRPEGPEGLTSKRVPMTVLNTISGNEGTAVSNLRDRPPPSMAADDPFQSDPQESIQVCQAKGTGSERKPQNRARISRIPIRKPSPKISYVDETKKTPQSNEQSTTVVRKPIDRSTLLQAAFNGTLNLRLTSGQDQCSSVPGQRPSSPDGVKRHDSQNTSPESAISTPTKKPSHRTSSTSRLSSIFDNPFTTSRPSPSHTNSSIKTPGKEPNMFHLALQNQISPTPTDPESRPPSFLFDFPFPPRPTSKLPHPNWRSPKTPIRGPRVPPHTFHIRTSPTRRPSRSPSRSKSPTKSSRVSKPHGSNPSFDLRNSIMTLRRQNSEVNNHHGRGSREHKRYLSIGDFSDGESAIFEIEDAEKDSGHAVGGRVRGEEGEGIKGSRTVPVFGEKGKVETPMKEALRMGRRSTSGDGQAQGIF